jgi:hypothetical protein
MDNISKARRALEKIQYFYDNAGPKGYSQALFYYNELATLTMSAQRSKKYQNEAPIINDFRKQAEPLMGEMKKWRDEWEQKTEK